MSRDQKTIVSTFFECVTAGKIDEAFSFVHDNVQWWIPGTLPFSGTKSKAQYMQVVGAIRNGFPTGFSLTVTGMVSEGNKIAAEVESLGKHVNGKSYNNKYHFLITVEKGLMVEVKEYMDTLHLFQLIQK